MAGKHEIGGLPDWDLHDKGTDQGSWEQEALWVGIGWIVEKS